MAKIYYVGDWAVMLGPCFAETPFNYAWKGMDVYNYGHWLKDALESAGEHQVASVPAWEFYRLPPGGYEKILAEYDVIAFSDVEAKLFQLDPHFFDRSYLVRAVHRWKFPLRPDGLRIYSLRGVRCQRLGADVGHQQAVEVK